MRVLVAVASRHGSTRQIADEVARVLEDSGLHTDVVDPDDVESLEGYDAVVLGSAVYVGRWAASARAMVDRLVDGLARRPVWLFSSGPLGFPAIAAEDPAEMPAIEVRTRARDHAVFAGRLDLAALGLAERAVVSLVRAPEGDFRRWDEIAAWAGGIATELHAEEVRGLRLVR